MSPRDGAFRPSHSPGLLRHKETFLCNKSHSSFLFFPEEPGCHSPSISPHLSPKAWFKHLLPEPSHVLLTGSSNVPVGLKPQESLPRSRGLGAIARPADSAAAPMSARRLLSRVVRSQLPFPGQLVLAGGGEPRSARTIPQHSGILQDTQGTPAAISAEARLEFKDKTW